MLADLTREITVAWFGATVFVLGRAWTPTCRQEVSQALSGSSASDSAACGLTTQDSLTARN
eukprot:436020-Amphidinium_carterae.1